jgi:hypothetical protein
MFPSGLTLDAIRAFDWGSATWQAGLAGRTVNWIVRFVLACLKGWGQDATTAKAHPHTLALMHLAKDLGLTTVSRRMDCRCRSLMYVRTNMHAFNNAVGAHEAGRAEARRRRGRPIHGASQGQEDARKRSPAW